jgi:hypothetical protein
LSLLLHKKKRATSAESKTRESDSGNPLQGYIGLVVQGLRILQGLAINEENCRVISKTEDPLSKTMAPLVSDKLHGDHHDEWSIIAVESLEFMQRLMATLRGTDTTKLRLCLVPLPKSFHPSHRMFGHMHGALNVDEKKLIVQFGWKSRDEFFKPN